MKKVRKLSAEFDAVYDRAVSEDVEQVLIGERRFEVLYHVCERHSKLGPATMRCRSSQNVETLSCR